MYICISLSLSLFIDLLNTQADAPMLEALGFAPEAQGIDRKLHQGLNLSGDHARGGKALLAEYVLGLQIPVCKQAHLALLRGLAVHGLLAICRPMAHAMLNGIFRKKRSLLGRDLQPALRRPGHKHLLLVVAGIGDENAHGHA